MQTLSKLSQGHLVDPPSRTDTQSFKQFPLSSGSRLDQCRSCSRAPMRRLNRWRTGLLIMFLTCFPLLLFAQSTSTLAALTSPIPGSQLTGTRVAFTWTAGEGASYYELRLGTTGVGSSDLYDRSETEAFSATVSGLPTNAETVYARLRSKIVGTWQSIDYTYSAELLKLSVSSANLAFGHVGVNSPAIQPITLSSTGTVPLTIKAVTLTGTGYTVSGATFPVTLNPGQTATLSVHFNPTTVGAASGQLTISSNSSTESTTVIGLSGTGEMVLATELSALSCGSTSMTGSGTDSCTVTLTAGAPSFGFSVSLSSSNTAVSVPATVTVPANASSGVFTATVSSVGTAQAATLTASALSVSKTLALQLNAAVPTLTINATSVAFGDVVLNTPSTQSVTLSSTGTASVTVNSVVVTGTGFTVPGAGFPATLTPGQTVTLSVQFDPTVIGAATGLLTVTSNSSTGSTAVIALSGTGEAASYSVDLSWDAPISSPDPVAGYNIYRSTGSSSTYQLLNSTVDSLLTFVDSTVQNGLVYVYMVESVDASGVESVPSNTFSLSIP